MCYAKFKSEDFSITVRKYEGNQYIMDLETGGKRKCHSQSHSVGK